MSSIRSTARPALVTALPPPCKAPSLSDASSLVFFPWLPLALVIDESLPELPVMAEPRKAPLYCLTTPFGYPPCRFDCAILHAHRPAFSNFGR